jgi:hypothetical protein
MDLWSSSRVATVLNLRKERGEEGRERVRVPSSSSFLVGGWERVKTENESEDRLAEALSTYVLKQSMTEAWDQSRWAECFLDARTVFSFWTVIGCRSWPHTCGHRRVDASGRLRVYKYKRLIQIQTSTFLAGEQDFP